VVKPLRLDLQPQRCSCSHHDHHHHRRNVGPLAAAHRLGQRAPTDKDPTCEGGWPVTANYPGLCSAATPGGSEGSKGGGVLRRGGARLVRIAPWRDVDALALSINSNFWLHWLVCKA
jgi:hypothetical protein